MAPAMVGALMRVLEEARALGFLGPGPVGDHLRHAEGFADAVGMGAPPARALDLGSGGGVPGLVLAVRWPTTRWALLDASQRRGTFLRRAAAELGLSGRVEVVVARAETVGRQAGARHQFDLVTARGFGPPAVTAECAAPLLRIGGYLVVSEPPEGGQRWPAHALEPLGLEPDEVMRARATYQRLRQRSPCPDRFPRRVGVPSKRPLF